MKPIIGSDLVRSVQRYARKDPAPHLPFAEPEEPLTLVYIVLSLIFALSVVYFTGS